MQSDNKPNGDPGEGRIFISNFIYAWISCLYHFINGESDKYVPKHRMAPPGISWFVNPINIH